MKIQNRKSVLHATKYSFDSIYSDCTSLMEELEAKEIDAAGDEKYFEAFLLQFSFIEWKLESAIKHFSKKLGIHPDSAKMLETEISVNRKITNFDCVLSSYIEDKSKKDFKLLIEKLREYNSFRNDLLHDCGNPKKFKSAIHIDQSLMEAYEEGHKIMKYLTRIKLKKI